MSKNRRVSATDTPRYHGIVGLQIIIAEYSQRRGGFHAGPRVFRRFSPLAKKEKQAARLPVPWRTFCAMREEGD